MNAFWSGPMRIGRTLLVFSLMTFAFVFFRGQDLTQSLRVAARLFSGWGTVLHPGAMIAELRNTGLPFINVLEVPLFIFVIEATQHLRSAGPLRPRIAALPVWCRWSLYYAVAAVVLLFVLPQTESFIYFGF